jgi:DNA invertase Pin-like site-specific DNA recombinase
MALVGYARVSSVGQSLDVQLDKLGHCDKIFQEKTSEVSATRPRLSACLEYLREGDTLVVTRLDRLAHSTLHLCQIAQALERKRVNLHVLDQHIDTRDATGRLLFTMLGAIGQFETEIRAERQMDGIAKARARGVRFGPKKLLTQDHRRCVESGGPHLFRSGRLSAPGQALPSLGGVATHPTGDGNAVSGHGAGSLRSSTW